MESNIISLKDKQMEQVIVQISTEVARAAEMIQQVKALSADSEARLICASLELEKLYVSIRNCGE